MARDRRSTAEESAAVPGQGAEPATRAEPMPPADAGSAPPTNLTPRSAPRPQDRTIHHTRLSGAWAAVIAFAVVLLLLLIFILQNSNAVEVSYFGAHGHLSLGVALLLAAVAGILLVALAGSARIMQLRTTARKHRRVDARARKHSA